MKKAHIEYVLQKDKEGGVRTQWEATKAEMDKMAEKMRLSNEAEEVQASKAQALQTYTEVMEAHGGGDLNKKIKGAEAKCALLEKERLKQAEVTAKRAASQ